MWVAESEFLFCERHGKCDRFYEGTSLDCQLMRRPRCDGTFHGGTLMFGDTKRKLTSMLETAICETQATPMEAREVAEGCDLGDLRLKQSGKAAALAVPTIIGGPTALLALPVEMGLLLRLMSTSALATGWVLGRSPHEEDFKLILGVWADKAEPKNLALAKAGAAAAPAAGLLSNVGLHVSSNAMVASSATTLATLGQAYVPYAAKKMAAQMLGNVIPKFLPVLGPLICGGVNAYVVNGVMDAAEKYYKAV